MPSRTSDRNHLMTAIEVYERSGAQRGYAATAPEIDAVLALYDDYDATLGEGSDALKGPGLAPALRTAVHDGYDFTQAGRKLDEIRTMLLRGVELCPICGISSPRELDHYLPRSVFNPLAIYVRNLVPLCHDCNHSKSAAAPTEAARRFIHVYLEPLPAIRFLRSVVTTAQGALLVHFEIDPEADLPALTRERLANQLVRLKLNERYGREINTYLTGHTIALHNAFHAAGVEGVREFLRQQAEVEFHVFHRNHWRPVMLVALAEDPGFCGGGFQAVLPMPLSVPAAGGNTGP